MDFMVPHDETMKSMQEGGYNYLEYYYHNMKGSSIIFSVLQEYREYARGWE